MVVEQPELRRQRVVLVRQDSRKGQLIAAASPLAEHCGVHIDMPLSEAKSLLARSRSRKEDSLNSPQLPERPKKHFAQLGTTTPFSTPPFFILPHDPTIDLYTIEKLADDLDGFSPIIGLQQETDRPDCIFLDVTGLAKLFESELKLAQGVFDFCERQGYVAHLAIANTIALAQGICQFADYEPETQANGSTQCFQAPPIHQDLSNVVLTRRVAGGKALTYASGNDSPAAHSSRLPVSALRLNTWTTTTLHQLGISTVGQLLKLPRQDLSARFGPEIYRRVDQMTGKIPEPIIARHPQPKFYAEQLIEHPTSHMETIEVILERLVTKICSEMAAAQQGALQWIIRMYFQDQKLPLKLYVNLFQPTTTTNHVLQLAKMQLENLQQGQTYHTKSKHKRSAKSSTSPFAEPVQEITISVTSCVLLTQRQRQLFDENPRLDRQELAHLINRLSGRLGRQNVVYPALVSGAQPEYAFRMKPLVNPYSRGPRRTANTQKTHALSHTMARPIKVFQPPIALETVSVTDNKTNIHRPPALLTIAGDQHNVINQWGPERIETGWWRGPTTRRDYWRVEIDSHQQFWIYRDLRKRTWFLQGEF